MLDAGCGDGRNLPYFLSRGFDCFGVDRDPAAVARVRRLAARARAAICRPRTFTPASSIDLPWDAGSMDAVICSAVLHFAATTRTSAGWSQEMWRVLAPDGLFFARLASNIGLETAIGPARPARPSSRRLRPLRRRRARCCSSGPSGWAARLLDPIKTTNVQQQRCMTTWCVVKEAV